MLGGGLTLMEERFVAEYLVEPSARRAALKAGYTDNTVSATRLMRSPRVLAAIEKARRGIRKEAEVDATRVLKELHRVALADIAGVFDDDGCVLPVKEIPEDVRRAIAGFEVEETWSGEGDDRVQTGRIVKVKFWDKNRGIETLAKHLGMLNEKVEVSVKFTDPEKRVDAVMAILDLGPVNALPSPVEDAEIVGDDFEDSPEDS